MPSARLSPAEMVPGTKLPSMLKLQGVALRRLTTTQRVQRSSTLASAAGERRRVERGCQLYVRT